jgi:hypothetical protein
MKRKTGDQLVEIDLKRVIRKALKQIEKVISEEPCPVLTCDGNTDNSSNRVSEITAWLFNRRYDDGNSEN